MPDPSNTEAEGARVIGICQNPEGPQPWFQADSTDEKCPEPYCDCEPKFYVALRSTPEAGTARVIPPLSDEARARQPDSCWADCGDHDWYCCGGEWDDPERREAIFAGSDAALRSTPEAGTGDETCPCCQRHCRRSPGFLEHGISLDMDLEVEAEERERGGPPSPLLALAEELEARADEQSGDYQVPIGDWSVRRWSQLRAWKGATLAYRKAAALARDYATREESDDD